MSAATLEAIAADTRADEETVEAQLRRDTEVALADFAEANRLHAEIRSRISSADDRKTALVDCESKRRVADVLADISLDPSRLTSLAKRSAAAFDTAVRCATALGQILARRLDRVETFERESLEARLAVDFDAPVCKRIIGEHFPRSLAGRRCGQLRRQLAAFVGVSFGIDGCRAALATAVPFPPTPDEHG